MDKEQLKLEKKIEREKNKMELERQKKLSKAMSTQIKNQKPEMCCNVCHVKINSYISGFHICMFSYFLVYFRNNRSKFGK